MLDNNSNNDVNNTDNHHRPSRRHSSDRHHDSPSSHPGRFWPPSFGRTSTGSCCGAAAFDWRHPKEPREFSYRGRLKTSRSSRIKTSRGCATRQSQPGLESLTEFFTLCWCFRNVDCVSEFFAAQERSLYQWPSSARLGWRYGSHSERIAGIAFKSENEKKPCEGPSH